MKAARLVIALLILASISVFLSGCEGSGPGEKDLAGGVRVTLKSSEKSPVFPGRLAVIRQGDLWVLESGKEPLRLTDDGCNNSPAWSPDGQWLLFYKYDPKIWNRHYSLWVARADGGGVYSIEEGKQVLDARWSPAANSIAYLTAKQGESAGSEEFKLTAVTDKGPGVPLSLKDASEKIMSFCWQPTGEKLVYTIAGEYPNTKENLTIRVIPAGGGESKNLLAVEPGFLPDAGTSTAYLGGIKFSPNNIDFNFFNVEFADTFQNNTHFESHGLKFVKEFNFEQLPGRPGDEQTPSQPPVVRVRISLEGSPQYNAGISYIGGIGYDRTVRCTVSFR
ncbi:MAG: hypothetical protein A4E53_02336 [Pelotomaculum sp. PtaB.Bin104]|nr:MAG: hypothetical protein A4E53_02336 [Pelotomaculum sp. PtaB.Bin104]